MVLLMAISESEIALISSIASLFSNAALAFLGMRSGESTAQMNVTVSSSRRVLVFLSMCRMSCCCYSSDVPNIASTSSCDIGCHQFGSLILILPRSVPNLGFWRLLLSVRTRSTTGTPRRQIVTGSPPSAILINSGSLFFASATLTCMTSL